MNLGLEGRIALVTGADSGMGRETAKMLLAEGVRVVISDQTTDELQQTVAELRSLGEVIGITANVTRTEDMKKLFTEVT